MRESLRLSVREQYFHFQTDKGIFSKSRLDPGTQLLAESMLLPEEGALLDLGCGYGAIGIVAAKSKPKLKVIMTDIDPKAIKLARENARLNNLTNIECRVGSVYDPVDDMRFVAIVINPPLSAGFTTVSRIIRDAPLHLIKEGVMQMVIRKGAKLYMRECESAFEDTGILARGSGYRVICSRLPKS